MAFKHLSNHYSFRDFHCYRMMVWYNGVSDVVFTSVEMVAILLYFGFYLLLFQHNWQNQEECRMESLEYTRFPSYE